MPDNDSPGPGSSGPGPSGPTDQPAGSIRNLPVPVPPAQVATRSNGAGWFTRAMRALLGWKPDTFRSDLRSVLEDGAADIGLSQRESAMLRNILSLRERRAVDVMIPRADIIAVQKEIPLGELMKLFESAAHSRLVV